MDADELEKRWQQNSQEAFHRIAQWREAHPRATMADIETAIDQQRWIPNQVANVARQVRRFSSHPEEVLVWLL